MSTIADCFIVYQKNRLAKKSRKIQTNETIKATTMRAIEALINASINKSNGLCIVHFTIYRL